MQPHTDPSLEIGILSIILLDPKTIDTAVGSGLRPGHFGDPRNVAIYAAMLKLHEDGKDIDTVLLKSSLPAIEWVYISSLLDEFPLVSNLKDYIRAVKDLALARQVYDIGRKVVAINNRDGNKALEYLREQTYGLENTYDKELGSIANDILPLVERIASGDMDKARIDTGWNSVNRLIQIESGNMVVFAGRPSMGKTSIALAIAENMVISQGKSVGIISLEMTREELSIRLLSSISRIDTSSLRAGKVGSTGMLKVRSAGSKLAGSGLYINDSPGNTIEEIRQAASTLKKANAIDLLIIDYLQLLEGGDPANRQQEVSRISRGIKLCAKELDIPIIAISQLSRKPESRPNKRPLLSDLRESGSIEQDADIVVFLYRDSYYTQSDDPTLEFICAKNRHGDTGTVKLEWDRSTNIFTEKEITFHIEREPEQGSIESDKHNNSVDITSDNNSDATDFGSGERAAIEAAKEYLKVHRKSPKRNIKRLYGQRKNPPDGGPKGSGKWITS